ncbi:hypothetical protein D3C80_1289560 [compost metagenome]
MSLNPLLSSVYRVSKLLYDFLMVFNIALLRHKYGIRQPAALRTKRCDDMTFSFPFKNGCLRLKELNKLTRARSKSSCNVGKLNVLNKIKILLRINTVLLQGELPSHLRHSTLSLTEKNAILQLGPIKILNILSCNQKGPISLR